MAPTSAQAEYRAKRAEILKSTHRECHAPGKTSLRVADNDRATGGWDISLAALPGYIANGKMIMPARETPRKEAEAVTGSLSTWRGRIGQGYRNELREAAKLDQLKAQYAQLTEADG